MRVLHQVTPVDTFSHLICINPKNKHIMPSKRSRNLTKSTVVEQWYSDSIRWCIFLYFIFILFSIWLLCITMFFGAFTIVHSWCFGDLCLLMQLFCVLAGICPGLMVQGWVSVLNTLPSVCMQSHEILAPFQKSTCMWWSMQNWTVRHHLPNATQNRDALL